MPQEKKKDKKTSEAGAQCMRKKVRRDNREEGKDWILYGHGKDSVFEHIDNH